MASAAALGAVGLASVAAFGATVAPLVDPDPDYSEMAIRGLSWRSGAEVVGSRIMQWMPESFTRSASTTWATIDAPLRSSSYVYWTGADSPTLTFTLKSTRSMPTETAQTATGAVAAAIGASLDALKPDPNGRRVVRYNQSVSGTFAFLDAFRLPAHAGGRVDEPPPVMEITVPGMRLSSTGSDVVTGVLQSLEYTVKSAFPNGEPRVAEFGITMMEIMRDPLGRNSTGTAWSSPPPYVSPR